MPEINTVSLLLGILVGILALLLFLKFKSRLHKINFSKLKGQKSRSFAENNEFLLRKHLLRKVQSLHIAADLFPLNTIYVPQKLYSHPLHADYGDNIEEEPVFFREALQIADVPELASALPMPSITLKQAISHKKNIAVSGTIGSGKTTCLVKLASEILEHSSDQGNISGYLPIYLDIRALTSQENPSPLLEAIAQALYDENEDLIPGEVLPVLTVYLNRSQILLLIDQLDELSPDNFMKAVNLLQHYHTVYPGVLLITTCGPYYSDGLSLAGFSILPIKPPDINDYNCLISKWLSAWNLLQPSTSGIENGLSETKLKQLWLKQALPSLTFFDQTTQIMSALFQGQSFENKSLIHYLFRTTNNPHSADILLKAAEWSAAHEFSGFSERDFSDFINRQDENKANSAINQVDPHDFLKKLVGFSLIRSIKGSYYFSNPSLLCELLSISPRRNCSYQIDKLSRCPMEDSITRYASATQDYLAEWIKQPALQKTKYLSIFLNHLFNPYRTPPDLSFAYPELAKRILSSSTPLSVKLKLASIIYYTKPTQLFQLLLKLESQPSGEIRKLCAFYYGLSSANTHIDYLIKCAMDTDSSVKVYGLNSLVNNLDDDTNTLLSQIIRSSKDQTGKISAELLAQNSEKGHPLLRELMADEGPVCRRNVIYGLRLIAMDWADQLLKEINSIDKVWIIRDAAAITLENKWDPASYAPRQFSNPANDPKLLRIASSRGQGIPAKTFPLDFLLETLNSDRYDEKLLAIQYLSIHPNDETLNAIELLTGQVNPVREVACQVLFEQELKI